MSRRSANNLSVIVAAGLATAMSSTGAMAAQEWEPTGETVNLLIVGGLVIVIVTYAAQAFVWLVSKSGMGDLGVMLGWYSQEGYYKANMDFIRVLRFAAIFAIFLGIIAAIVGWAKGTL